MKKFISVIVAGLVLSACSGTAYTAITADEAKAKQIMSDIAADAAPVGECALSTALAIAAAITTGNYVGILGNLPCIANAIALIKAQVDAGKAPVPPLQNIKAAQGLHALSKAATQ